VNVPGAVAVDEAVLGAEHPAAVNRQSATANTMAAQIFIFKKRIKLAQLRPNIAWFVQKDIRKYRFEGVLETKIGGAICGATFSKTPSKNSVPENLALRK
jgi:hypothetical protein